MDHTTRKLMTVYEVLHSRDDLESMRQEKKEVDHSLVLRIECKATLQRLEMFIKMNKE